jgi:hypothetical protein
MHRMSPPASQRSDAGTLAGVQAQVTSLWYEISPLRATANKRESGVIATPKIRTSQETKGVCGAQLGHRYFNQPLARKFSGLNVALLAVRCGM